MSAFNSLGLAGRGDHGPKVDVKKTHKSKVPSSSDEEGETSGSDRESNEGSERYFSGSDEDNEENNDGDKATTDTDDNDIDGDDDEEEQGAQAQGPSAHPLPVDSTVPDPGTVVPPPPAATDGDDGEALNMEMGTIDFIRAPWPQEASATSRPSNSPDMHA